MSTDIEFYPPSVYNIPMKENALKVKKTLSPTVVLLLGFLAVIAVGTVLLMLPVSSRSGQGTDPLSAAFTAVSATCVTGLVAVDTGSHFSLFGQSVILLLIQVGGLGFMSMAVMISMLIRRAITPKERVLIAQSMGLDRSGGTVRFVRRLLIGTFAMEGTGAVLLMTRFIPRYGLVPGVRRSIFIAVSAFCNAGFDPFGTLDAPYCSLTDYAGDATVLITVMLLVAIGGIGFVVWEDIYLFFKERHRLHPYSKFILALTGALILAGAALTALFEWGNPATLGGLSFSDKILNCFFQSVTLRTAGFNTLDLAAFTESGAFISIIFMLIGGASGSTAGGIKVGTVGVVFAAAVSAAMGRTRVYVFGRKVSRENIMRALSVAFIGGVIVITAALAITALEGCSLIGAMYEAATAYATVGCSMIGTPATCAATKLLLMALMYTGRVGLLTVTYTIALRMRSEGKIDYPEINIPIG